MHTYRLPRNRRRCRKPVVSEASAPTAKSASPELEQYVGVVDRDGARAQCHARRIDSQPFDELGQEVDLAQVGK